MGARAPQPKGPDTDIETGGGCTACSWRACERPVWISPATVTQSELSSWQHGSRNAPRGWKTCSDHTTRSGFQLEWKDSLSYSAEDTTGAFKRLCGHSSRGVRRERLKSTKGQNGNRIEFLLGSNQWKQESSTTVSHVTICGDTNSCNTHVTICGDIISNLSCL